MLMVFGSFGFDHLFCFDGVLRSVRDHLFCLIICIVLMFVLLEVSVIILFGSFVLMVFLEVSVIILFGSFCV
jgi:hypothetical protein